MPVDLLISIHVGSDGWGEEKNLEQNNYFPSCGMWKLRGAAQGIQSSYRRSSCASNDDDVG